MITIFRSKFKIRILYKSGNSHEFWSTKFNVKNGIYTWVPVGKVTPLVLGADQIEAVYQIDIRVNFLRFIGLVNGEL